MFEDISKARCNIIALITTLTYIQDGLKELVGAAGKTSYASRG